MLSRHGWSFPRKCLACTLGSLPETKEINVSRYWRLLFGMNGRLCCKKSYSSSRVLLQIQSTIQDTYWSREFEVELFSEMCSLLGIIKSRATPYRPQSDGMAERFNWTLQQMLCMFVNENRPDWDHHLPYLLIAYHLSVQESTKWTTNFYWC